MASFTKDQPFKARLKTRYPLTQPGSHKHTVHVVLDLKGSNIAYKAGDCVGIWPANDPLLVQQTCEAAGLTGLEEVYDERRQETLSLRDFLTHRANLAKVQKKLVKALAAQQTDLGKRNELEQLLDCKPRLKEVLAQHFVWDFLLYHPEVKWSAQEFITVLQAMVPRFYSIASSQGSVGEEVHLTIGQVEYETLGQRRRGTATHFLCNWAEVGKPHVPVYLQPTKDFLLPEDPSTPIIMIGPGTGIAPFVAFMQEREQHVGTENWLFFGECYRATDFYYEAYWTELVQRGTLRLDTAFSRDQLEKIYVQDRMWERKKDLWDWIERGAVLYVCGDADRMAKDVEKTLLRIFMQEGSMHEDDAKSYLKKLRKSKRYLRDVY